MNSSDIRRKHSEYLFPAVKNYYREPVVIVSGKGAEVTDMDGRKYLDFFGGILTVSVGHANPDVTTAIKDQVDRLTHVSTLYPTVPLVELAELLADLAPGDLTQSFFTASGTEADETAVMMAQVFTGNVELIVLRHGYAGRSLLAQSITAHSAWRVMPTQVPSIKHALAPYCYRCPLRQTYPECGVACAQDVKELIETTTTGQVAGIMVEPIQGVGGFITPPKEYFAIVAEIVRQHGGIFISDEVQTGFGRTGKTWGIEQYGVEPDMITVAKGIANGLPLGAVVTRPEIAGALKKNSISTFGGNPVSCAAAKATIEVIVRDRLAENAHAMGALLSEGLLRIQKDNPAMVGEVRGMGLMQAIELVVDETAQDRTPNPQAADALMEETKKRGLLIGRGGLYGNTVRIAPALNITSTQVDEAVRIMSDSFKAMSN